MRFWWVGLISAVFGPLAVFVLDNSLSVALYAGAGTILAFSSGFFYAERTRERGKRKTFLGERPLEELGSDRAE